MYKKCTVCLKLKLEKEFHRKRDGFNPDCADCRNKRKRKRNIERRLKCGPTAYKEKNKQFRLGNQPYQLFRHARSRARNNGLEFSLKLEDIIIPEVCPILGIKIVSRKEYEESGGTKRNNDYGPSIDRINNKKGYTADNIIICSWRANRLKGGATYKEIRAIYKFMKKYHGKTSQPSYN